MHINFCLLRKPRWAWGLAITLLLPSILWGQISFYAQPSPSEITAASGYRVNLEALASTPTGSFINYTWYLNGSPAPGTNNEYHYHFTLGPATAGSYTVRAYNSAQEAWSQPAVVTLGGPGSPTPALVANPTSARMLAGQNFQLTSASPPNSSASYQWYKDGAPIPGGDNYSLTLIRVQPAHSGQYFCRITTNGVPADTNPSSLEIVATAPTGYAKTYATYYWGQPFPPEMSGVLLMAGSNSSPATQYQWSKEGVPIPGATGQTLMTSFETSHPQYSVAVTNSLGTSTLTFKPAPSTPVTRTLLIHESPRPGAILPGERVVLRGEAYGSPAISYQWYKDGTAIPGATSSFFTIPAASVTANGVYQLGATNSLGSQNLGVARVLVDDSAWQLRTGSPTAHDLNGVTHGANGFVAVGNQGTILTSADGVMWTVQTCPSSADLRAVVHAGGRYVAVGADGVILSSPNGTSWSIAPAVTTRDLTSVAHQSGTYVAVGRRGVILSSTDGVTWTVRDSGHSAGDYNRVVAGSGRFIANAAFFTTSSTDGTNWSHEAPLTDGSISTVAFAGGHFEQFHATTSVRSVTGTAWFKVDARTPQVTDYTVFQGRRIFISMDTSLFYQNSGSDYRNAEITGDGRYRAIAASESILVAVGAGGCIATSADGMNWTPRQPSRSDRDLNRVELLANGSLAAFNEGGGYAGRPMLVSDNAATWSVATGTPSPAYVARSFVRAGNLSVLDGNQRVHVTTDGQAWTHLAASVDTVPMAFGADRYVFFNNTPKYSADGLSWQTGIRTAVSANWNEGVAGAYGNDTFVVVSLNGFAARSTDGITWVCEGQTVSTFRDVIFGNGVFVAVGRDQAYTSVDGRDWLPSVLGAGELTRIRFLNGRFFVPTSRGILFTSIDGLTWTDQRIPGYGLQDVAIANDQIVVVGQSGAILAQRDPLAPAPPMVSAQPADLGVVGGASATFTVGAVGAATLTYQWQRSPAAGGGWSNLANGGNYSGATGTTLKVTNASLAMAGDEFRCVVTNSQGSATSRAALLAVRTPVKVTTDFNGDGKSDLILAHATTGLRYAWFFNGTNYAGEAHLATLSADWVISGNGDFDRDGESDLLVTNTQTGARYIWLMDDSTYREAVHIGTVPPEWEIGGTGDFNADGLVDILISNTTTGDRYIWLMRGTVYDSSIYLGKEGAAWRIVGAGDFNQDDKPDILWQNTGNLAGRVWLMNGTTQSSEASLSFGGANWQMTGTGDYNNDSHADIVWQNASTGERRIWLMNGMSLGSSVSLGILPLDWTLGSAVMATPISVSGDFNGDGKPDLVLQNRTTGDRYIWLMNGTNYSDAAYVGNIGADWEIAGKGDFNGDGKTDLVWQNTVTGDRYIWTMNGTTYTGEAYLGNVPPSWDVAGTGDFNGDGKPDLILQNLSTGDRYVWLMNGTTYQGEAYLGQIGTDWRIAGSADFNQDGKADLIWQNRVTGDRYIWTMNGTTYTGEAYLGTVGTDWDIAGAVDFSGDGKPDLVLQNTVTGDRYIWTMNGTTYTGEAYLGFVGPAWRIVR